MERRATLRLAGACVVLLTGCSSAPVWSPDSGGIHSTWRSPAKPRTDTASAWVEPSLEDAQEATIQAMALVGVPYKWGGNTPDTGFDCSGLISYAYRRSTGIKTPRTVKEISEWGRGVDRSQARAGDLAIFGPADAPTHAGIYVGQGRFVHAPRSGGTVRIEDMGKKYWQSRFLGFRRPLA